MVYFIFIKLYFTHSQRLTQILLEDIFGDVLKTDDDNEKCDPSSASGSFSFDSDLKAPYFDDNFIAQEKEVFLAEIEHEDIDPSKSWKIRIGKGGNIYSYVGPIGQAMPPNREEGMYMVDEVWQNVAVDQRLNNSPDGEYFIHQAGPYQHDSPRTDMPFAFSPSVAHYCSETLRECRFASWGTVNPTPTKYRTKGLFVTRYRDCGDGVLEVTAVVHNFDNKLATDLEDYSIDHTIDTNFRYLSFPWFGVNERVYRDILINKSPSSWITKWPNPSFDLPTRLSLMKSGGFTTAAEFRRHNTNFVFPGLEIADANSDTVPKIILKEKRRGTSCQSSNYHSTLFKSYHVRCLLDTNIIDIRGCKGCELTFTNSITNQTLDIVNVVHWMFSDKFIYFAPLVGEERYIKDSTDYDKTFANELTSFVNSILTPNSEILISWKDSGLSDDENHCLVLVHGRAGSGLMEFGSARSYRRSYMVLVRVFANDELLYTKHASYQFNCNV